MSIESRIDNLRYILRTLLAEREEYAGWQIPDTLEKRQTLMRALLNVRPPLSVNPKFLQAQDTELKQQLADKGIVTLSDIPSCQSDGRFRIWQGDITRLQADAIVNAANNALLGCFVPLHRCIDNAIHSAAGVQLRLECDKLMRAQGHPEPTGCAKITKGYNLPARYVLHTVGPIVRDGKPTPEQEMELAGCYRSCLTLADAHKLTSIAFCCISTGEFGFPQERAAQIAVETVIDCLKTTSYIQTVVFNVFKDEDLSIYRGLLP